MMDANNAQKRLEKLSDDLQRGDMREFRALYLEFREPFLAFARKYSQDEELLIDVYHDCFIVLYENIISGKLRELQSSLKTYVFSIGKYSLFNALKKRNKHISLELHTTEVPEPVVMHEKRELTENGHRMLKHFRALGDSCKKLLRLFYYENFSIEVIMHRMQYKNENTVKAHKSRCMKALKEAMLSEKPTR